MYMLRQIMNKITLEQKLARSTQTTSLITANEAYAYGTAFIQYI